MAVHTLDSESAARDAIATNKAVVIDWFATWCAPCKVIAPHFHKYSEDEKHKDIFFLQIDVDKMSALADELDVQAMPTFMLFRDGKKFETVVEPNPVNLLELVEKGL